MHPLLLRQQAQALARTGETAPTLSPTASVVGTVLVFAGLGPMIAKMGTPGPGRFTRED